jgi:hypothetical protein
MERLNAYTRPAADGKGITVDVEGMLVDLITVLKASGCAKDEFLAMAGGVFDEVTVNIRIPPASKN